MKNHILIIIVCVVSSCIDFRFKSSQVFPEYEFNSTIKIIRQLNGNKSKEISFGSTEKLKDLFTGDACYFKNIDKLDDFYENELGSITFFGKTDTLNLILRTSAVYDDRIRATFTKSEYSLNSNLETTSYHRFYIKKECYDIILGGE